MQNSAKLQWTAGVAAAIAIGAGTMTLVRAFNPQPDPPGHYFGLVGLVEGQTIQLNVSNYAPTPAPGQFPPDPCRVSLTFFDAAGHVVATKSANVGPGLSDSLSLNFTRGSIDGVGDVAVGGGGAGRTYVRGAMVYRRTGRDASTSCLASMEVVDAAGGTTGFTNPGVLVGFNPQPDPPGDFVSR